MEVSLFKIKKGKLKQWKNWCEFLLSNKNKAKDTMEQERVCYESVVLFSLNSDYYVVGLSDFYSTPIKSDLNNPLNVEHRRHMKECLIRLNYEDKLYEFYLDKNQVSD